MIFHWLFIITTLVLCAVAVLPTRFWLRSGEWIKTRGLRTKQTRLQSLLAAQRQPFTPELSFLERGVGLAVDKGRALVFLASSENGGMRATILPCAALGGHALRMLSDNGFQEYFVEISTPGTAQPLWRLDCDDAPLAAEVDDALSRI
ncbi:MAG: hypothetical protein KGQ79_06170 [Proteobacteria bacterium]|nr:hypothetical protein [Pseudomonadota bacterium]MBU6425109.1 hypothetical protein [Rhodospirillales bacterium]